MPVDLEAISRSLGLGSGTGRNSKLAKALLRLVQFGYLKPFGGAVEGYWVRTRGPAERASPGASRSQGAPAARPPDGREDGPVTP